MNTVRRIVSYYARPASFATGGVNTSRQQWMREYASLGQSILMINAAGGFEQQLVDHPAMTWINLRHQGRSRMTMIPRKLGRILRETDVVYLHEGWTTSNLYVAALCYLRRIPYVVMPHGVYSKLLVTDLRFLRARRIAESWLLRHAKSVHVFFDSEVADVLAVSPRAKTITAVTGMDLPSAIWATSGEESYIAWVGRYDIQHKGIDRLFSALASMPSGNRPRILMHGPDHRGDLERVKVLVDDFGLAETVFVGGPLDPAGVERLLLESQGFIHVPRWEAFGRTIAECLVRGVPIVLSGDAEMARSLNEENAAIIIKGDDLGITQGIEQLREQGEGVGRAGREWAKRNLEWQLTARNALRQLGLRTRSLDVENEPAEVGEVG